MEDKNKLYHHGIKGQKWGVRRFQNEDGTYTADGKARRKVFVSGSSKTTTEGQPYYRPKLHKKIVNELNKHIKNENTILIGDAPGIDSQVQDYLSSKKYKNVEVYTANKEARYLANDEWKVNRVDSSKYQEGSREALAEKDKAMTNDADEGLAVILENGSRATRANVERIIEQNKNVKVFEIMEESSKYDRWSEIDELIRLEKGL